MSYEIKDMPGVPDTERSPEFQQRMTNATGVSFFKYGAIADAYPHKVNALKSLEDRLKLYREGGVIKGNTIAPGNVAYLVDIANFAEIEYMAPSMKTWDANDEKDSPGRQLHSTGEASEERNLTPMQEMRRGNF